MKKITFIRHAQLEKPYDNYDKVTFSDLDKIAINILSPGIDKDLPNTKKALNEIGKTEIDLILYAPSKRAFQTARLINNTLRRKAKLEKTVYLKEIHFNPKSLTTEKDFKQFGMNEIRIKFFENILLGEGGVEKISQVFKRIKRLDKYLGKTSNQSTLVITHGFLMRFLQLYFLKSFKSYENLTIADLKNAKNYHFLKGFKVTLS